MVKVPVNMFNDSSDYEAEREWFGTVQLRSRKFICANCSSNVASDEGYVREYISEYSDDIAPNSSMEYGIYLCPHCDFPTYFNEENKQFPMPSFGKEIADLPEDVGYLYNEARSSFSAAAFTGAVLLSRKALSNIAIHFGAEDGKSFAFYVEFLDNNGYIPKNSKAWVDKIRTTGNDATHKKDAKTKEEAETTLKFLEMLLVINFEYLKEDL
ncbi:DUF4145 domain-containing protein [Desemzia sp. C1]|uniref:DUF4145 domain-containing protein n=1 Tax=Desemzia sp. C1 TaxID=2892016 RepID=UPI001E5EB370|nr:DUF4145 domain-containing protein [Desemzia sp. C1]MCI3029819.1 DUF4145 domain-containing protein [Desemzia sp. C1]